MARLSDTNEREEPTRGEFCPKCKNYIPQFAGLSEAQVKRLRSLPPAEAMRELQKQTGCSVVLAKVWVVHPNGPHKARIKPPCPFCGEPLFSERTRQCLKCDWDWHNPDDLKNLREGIAQGEAAVRAGRVMSQDEAKRRLARWLTPKNPTDH